MLSSLASCVAAASCIAVGTAAPAAGSVPFGEAQQDLAAELEVWRMRWGDAWRVVVDPGTGYAEMLYGGGAPSAFQPATRDEWVAVAWEHLVHSARIHGIDPVFLQADASSVSVLRLHGARESRTKTNVVFTQWYGGLGVVDAAVNVLLDDRGSLLSVQSTASPSIASLLLEENTREADAIAAALRLFARGTDEQLAEVTGTSLVIKQSDISGVRMPYLAWQVDIQPLHTALGSERIWIDAQTGVPVARKRMTHDFDVGGTATTNATPLNNLPDVSYNFPMQMPLPYVRVTANGGLETFTDSEGNWNFAGIMVPLNVTVEYSGSHTSVYDDAGSEHFVTIVAQPGSNNTVVLNPTPDESTTAEANGYVVVNYAGEWLREFGGDVNVLLPPITVQVNDSEYVCSGAASQSTIFVGPAGGGCANMAYGSVVAHEMGHILNSRFWPGESQDSLDEGNADVWAMYVFDDHCVARDHAFPGSCLRTGENARMFCGDEIPLCTGNQQNAHVVGEVWMGAAWRVREALNLAYGDSGGDAIANSLFLSWMSAYDQSRISASFQLQWLILDDDDANLSNCTPHYEEIRSGFEQHGFPDSCLPGCQ